MNPERQRSKYALLALLVGLALPVIAKPKQDSERQLPKAPENITVQVSAVSLFATVRDKDGEVVSKFY